MPKKENEVKDIKAKTFNLTGRNFSSDNYFKVIDNLVAKSLELYPNLETTLIEIQQYSNKKATIKRILKKQSPKNNFEHLLLFLSEALEVFTLDIEHHLKALPLFSNLDPILKTTRAQYYLFMLEVEITSRIYINAFKKCDRKVALIPHCLKDLNENCKAEITGFDYVCKHCQKDCWINQITRILEKYSIDHYLWTGDSFKGLVKETVQKGESFGMLGVACIPELINGMRACEKINIPVVGLPIDGNCCRRWWGQTYQGTFNLKRLELLLSR